MHCHIIWSWNTEKLCCEITSSVSLCVCAWGRGWEVDIELCRMVTCQMVCRWVWATVSSRTWLWTWWSRYVYDSSHWSVLVAAHWLVSHMTVRRSLYAGGTATVPYITVSHTQYSWSVVPRTQTSNNQTNWHVHCACAHPLNTCCLSATCELLHRRVVSNTLLL